MTEIAKAALDVAITQLGQEEKPRGSNWGHPVQDYLASVGIGFPASWCLAFVYWCYDQSAKNPANQANPLFRTGGVLNEWNKRQANVVKDPQSGDIFIMDFGHGLGHTGFVERVDGQTLYTIEGNTNDTGSREGYEVCRRTRQVSKMKGFLRF